MQNKLDEQVVVPGALERTEDTINWIQFFLHPAGDVLRDVAVKATMNSRGDW